MLSKKSFLDSPRCLQGRKSVVGIVACDAGALKDAPLVAPGSPLPVLDVSISGSGLAMIESAFRRTGPNLKVHAADVM